MTVRRSGEGTIDASNTCNVLHVPRSKSFDVRQLFLNPDAVKIARAFFQQEGAAWLGRGRENDVLNCTFNKDVETPAGVVSIFMKPRQEYLDIVRPGDLLFVFMDDAGDHEEANRFNGTFVTIAVVDRCEKITQVENGATGESIAISSRDLGSVLGETSTVFDSAFAKIEQAFFTGAYIQQLHGKNVKAASPLENVLILLRLIYDIHASQSQLAGLQWQLRSSDGTSVPLISLLDITSFVQWPMPGYALPDAYGVLQTGNVWELLSSYSNRIVNEFFVDVRDINPQEVAFQQHLSQLGAAAVTTEDMVRQDATIQDALRSPTFRESLTRDDRPTSVMALVLRQRPYDTDTFSMLPVTEIDATEIETDSTGFSSHDVYNWFRVRFPSLPAEFQEFIEGILVNLESVARFGFRRMEAETRYMFLSSDAATKFDQGDSKQSFSDVFGFYIGLLSTWFAANDRMRSGSISMRFCPSIRVGTRVRVHKKDGVYDYYVQGVQHSFNSEPGASRTHLTVTRGIRVDNHADGIENQLYWDGRRSRLPSTVYGQYRLAGFQPNNVFGGTP